MHYRHNPADMYIPVCCSIELYFGYIYMYIFLHFVTIGTYIFPHLWGTRLCFALKATRFVSDVSHFLKMLDLAYQNIPVII